MVALPILHGAFRHAGAHQVALHQHPQHELILVCSGHLRTAMAGQDHHGSAGVLHVVPSGCAHDQRSAGAWTTICLHCTGSEAILPAHAQSIALGDDPRFRRWAEDLCDLHRDGADPHCANALLAAFLHHLPRPTSRPAAVPSALVRACAFMDAHIDQAITDEAVAAAVALSVSHLGALFREHHGCGPLRWLQDQRMDRAARLLVDPYTTVQQVAQRCGYSDATHFIRHFKRRHGQTPGVWRSGTSP